VLKPSWAAIEHDCRKVREVRTVGQLLDVIGERNSHGASFVRIVRGIFAQTPVPVIAALYKKYIERIGALVGPGDCAGIGFRACRGPERGRDW
jgi:hypothetical protein